MRKIDNPIGCFAIDYSGHRYEIIKKVGDLLIGVCIHGDEKGFSLNYPLFEKVEFDSSRELNNIKDVYNELGGLLDILIGKAFDSKEQYIIDRCMNVKTLIKKIMSENSLEPPPPEPPPMRTIKEGVSINEQRLHYT